MECVYLLKAGRTVQGGAGRSSQQRPGCGVLLERAGVEGRRYLDPHGGPEQNQIPVRAEPSE